MSLNRETQTTAPQPRKLDEIILVVNRDHLFTKGEIQGFLPCNDFAEYETLITQHQEFMPRGEAEVDTRYKQIIPYLVFKYKDRYFIMQRKSTASEQRLKNKFSLGIGGHLRQADITSTSLAQWAVREFCEEIKYTGTYTTTPLGIINDDSNDVGKVHIGFAILLEGTSDQISIKSELKDGFLATLDECTALYSSLESWSQLVVTALQNTKTKELV